MGGMGGFLLSDTLVGWFSGGNDKRDVSRAHEHRLFGTEFHLTGPIPSAYMPLLRPLT